MSTILQPTLPTLTQRNTQWSGLSGSAIPLALAELISQLTSPLLIITANLHQAEQLKKDIDFFSALSTTCVFPDREILPFDHFSPHPDLISERLKVLAQLPQQNSGVTIVALPTLLSCLPPTQYLSSQSLILKTGMTFATEHYKKIFTESGYRRVSQVIEHGDWLMRGSIIDLFPMGSQRPIRIELFDDTIETLRYFDPESQRTIEKITSIEILPANEYPLNQEGITRFREAWRERFKGNPMESPTYQNISEGITISGIENHLPLFFASMDLLTDYLPKNTLVVKVGDLEQAAKRLWKDISDRYEQYRHDLTRPLCPPEDLFASYPTCLERMAAFQQITINDASNERKKSHSDFKTKALPSLTPSSSEKNPYAPLSQFLNPFSGKTLITAESAGRVEVVKQQLKENGITTTAYSNWANFVNTSSDTPGIMLAPITIGFQSNAHQLAVITETELFGETLIQLRKKRKQRVIDPDTLIRHLSELAIGSPVVHLDHGVGRYQGLQTITTHETEAEYLTLEYAHQAKVYVPITCLHMISRYSGSKTDHAPLNTLGSQQWAKAKKKAFEQIHDVAAELLEQQAIRQATPGFTYKMDAKELTRFQEGFPFELTPDQATAITATIDDMTQPLSMDRLICGDVGFGKTEVAMQAAFVAAMNGKQVAILTPTTLLANQHHQSFSNRFAHWPIKIGILSRLQTTSQQQNTLQELQQGTIDIVIGTHKILQKDLKIKDLGLLIIDEEHRFGVRQKERIKALRAHIDILTLTATPIPRTLNMALSGSRDLSIIATPPERRLAIKTFVHRFETSMIHEALLRETMRGGQSYFLHNDIATLPAMKDRLQAIAPQVRIAIAHGQMPKAELEHIMADFYHQKYHILLCTTIIESGIDVPTANTMIINHADRFGLSQLHQIRGRVGRSHHQAYAYLLVEDQKTITKDAKQRLDALCQLKDLGAGFSLATHDLEIRGAGNLLGEQQSGHMQTLGYSLYMELLDQTTKQLQAGEKPHFNTKKESHCDIDLGASALIPETYIHDINTRLTLYKRINDCKTDHDLHDIKSEMIDRFGLLPHNTETLITINNLSLGAVKLGIEKIEIGKSYGYATFSSQTQVDPRRLITLIQNQPEDYRMHNANCLRFRVVETTIDKKIQLVKSLFSELNISK